MHRPKRILFICKKNQTYGFTTYTRRSSGLYNSTRFIVESLEKRGICAKIVEVVDNNCIDREVSEFRPDMVIIEALWVVPPKFLELKRLHPKVKWFIHLHSHIPFLALEGIAMEWCKEYERMGLGIIANSIPAYDALKVLIGKKHLYYLPNVYLITPARLERRFPRGFPDKTHIDVGCFGAVRPLKNQLLQAMAALQFAKEIDKPLRFHINASRMETGGEPVMKGLLALFSFYPNAALIQHAWHEPEDFIRQLHMKIDIGLQVSLTETFNVVTADYVTAGVPAVVSKEVAWMPWFAKAQDDDINSIVRRMHWAYKLRCLTSFNRRNLERNSARAQYLWYLFVEQNGC